MIGISGNGGEAFFDATTGEFLSENREGSDPDHAGYRFIKLDIDEWKRTYPGEDPSGVIHDCLDFGAWLPDGIYLPADKEWRADFRALRGKDY